MHELSALIQDFPLKVQAIIDNELDAKETMIWLGRPIPRLRTRGSWALILFSIPWTAFSLFWIAGASGFQIPDFTSPEALFPLFGVPFVLVGLGMMTSPYWMKRAAKKTAYILTSERAIIIKGGMRMNIRSFLPDSLGDLERSQDDEGCGDIVFGKDISRGSKGSTHIQPYGFLGIADVKEVEKIVRALASTADSDD